MIIARSKFSLFRRSPRRLRWRGRSTIRRRGVAIHHPRLPLAAQELVHSIIRAGHTSTILRLPIDSSGRGSLFVAHSLDRSSRRACLNNRLNGRARTALTTLPLYCTIHTVLAGDTRKIACENVTVGSKSDTTASRTHGGITIGFVAYLSFDIAACLVLFMSHKARRLDRDSGRCGRRMRGALAAPV